MKKILTSTKSLPKSSYSLAVPRHYYRAQAGGALPAFYGVRYQKGNGFFGRLFRGLVVPGLRFLGSTALKSGAKVASDVFRDGKSFKDSIEKRGLEAGSSIADAAYESVKEQIAKRQSGQGRKKKRRSPKRAPKRKIKRKSSSKTKKRRTVKKTIKRKKVTKKRKPVRKAKKAKKSEGRKTEFYKLPF